MSHLHRFHIPKETPEGCDRVVLPPEEAHHASRVVRVQKGDAVELFDGVGRRVRGRVAEVTKRDVVVEVREDERLASPVRHVTLIQGWLHRDKVIEQLIRGCTEVGVRRFVFFQARRSEKRPHVKEKWSRIALECLKQCGRLWLPEFQVIEDFSQALEGDYDTRLLALQSSESRPLAEAVAGHRVAIIIGPEGALTDNENARAIHRGARPVSLGPVTYRAEAAALLASTLVLNSLCEFEPATGP